MAIYRKDAGDWKTPTQGLWRKDGGLWKPVEKGWRKDAGIWKPVYERTVYALDYLGAAADLVSRSSYTFNTVPFGAEHSTREIFILGRANNSFSTSGPSSITIGGVTATLSIATSTSTCIFCAFALVPTNASPNIVVNFSGSHAQCVIGAYRVTKRPVGGARTDVDWAWDSSNDLALSACTVDANGFILGLLVNANGNAVTSSFLTEDYDQAHGSFRYWFGHLPIQVSASTPTQHWTWSGSVLNIGGMWAFK